MAHLIIFIQLIFLYLFLWKQAAPHSYRTPGAELITQANHQSSQADENDVFRAINEIATSSNNLG